MSKIRVVSIDGNNGVGKTTQAKLLKNKLKNTDILSFPDSVEEAVFFFQMIQKALRNNLDRFIIVENSIAKLIAKDLLAGIDLNTLMEKYREINYLYSSLNHEFGMATLVLTLEDSKECIDRIQKRNLLNPSMYVPLESYDFSVDFMSVISSIDNHVATQDIKIQKIVTYKNDSMIEVHEKILKELKDKDLPFK